MTKTYLKYRNRVTVISSIVLISWAGLSFRLFDIMVLNGKEYHKIGLKQGLIEKTIPANRGNIYDRDGRPLTRNIIHYTLEANPQKVQNKKELAELIHNRTGKGIDYYLTKLNRKGKFVYLERNLSRDVVGTLIATQIKGFKIKREYRRYYPHETMASQVLGYTSVDDDGISGLEKDFNQELKGQSGSIIKSKYGNGKTQFSPNLPYTPEQDGNDIQLTLDLEYQSILQEELNRRLKETGAKTATGIIMDPQTGEILAMATEPGFNNNQSSESPADFHRNRALTDQFEPGSTYKVVPAVAAFEQKVVDLTEEFNCENGSFMYKNIPIRDHEEYGLLTFPQVIEHSSNIGIIKIAERLGQEELYKYSREFGFGSQTRISFKGELSGTLKPIDRWSHISLGQISMGHEVGVTALQLASAYSSIANGGFLVVPKITRQIMSPDGEILRKENPEITRKVATGKTMSEITNMLCRVVKTGTGTGAEISGWNVAGKTGTAQKYIDGKYSDSKFISNFVGFLPADNPQLLGVFVLDEPKAGYHWGGIGAAKIFNRVMTRVISMDDKITPPSKKHYVHPKDKVDVILVDSKKLVVENASSLPISLSTKSVMKYVMPELRGMSMRKAMTTLRESNLKYKLTGSGSVVWQSPSPGTYISSGTVCRVGLK